MVTDAVPCIRKYKIADIKTGCIRAVHPVFTAFGRLAASAQGARSRSGFLPEKRKGGISDNQKGKIHGGKKSGKEK